MKKALMILGTIMLMGVLDAQAARCTTHDGMGRFYTQYAPTVPMACANARAACHRWHELNRGNVGLCGWGAVPARGPVSCAIRDGRGRVWRRRGGSFSVACARARTACYRWHRETQPNRGWCSGGWAN